MREIKFRAWNGKKMRGIEKSDFFSIRNDGMLSMQLPDADFNPPLMQYTGLKDKNGVEIYEGDILRVTRKNPAWDSDIVENLPVIYESCKFIVKTSHQSLTVSNSYFGITMKVIGNIHQNPELLD